jgi:hypothetical protein
MSGRLAARDSNREGFRELKGDVLIMCPWTEGSELGVIEERGGNEKHLKDCIASKIVMV